MSQGRWLKYHGHRLYLGHDVATAPMRGIPNTIGWLPIVGCGGFSTDVCRAVCYAESLSTRVSKQSRETLEVNWTSVNAILTSEGANGLTDAFALVMREAFGIVDAYRKRYNVAIPKLFRWTWSGDLFAPEVAIAITNAHLSIDDGTGWIYTRSPFLDELMPAVQAGRLKVMQSADKSNAAFIAYHNRRIEAKYGIRLGIFRLDDAPNVGGIVCPKIAYKARFPLAKAKGDVGPCVRCGMCVDPHRKPRDIRAPIHGATKAALQFIEEIV